MRIAAIGDSHLGRSVTNSTTPEGINQREADFELSFHAALDGAIALEPDVLVWLGDIFDHPRPSYRSFRVAMAGLRKIRESGTRLVAISGNHDTPRLPGVGNPYAVLADAFPEFRFAYRLEYEQLEIDDLRFHLVPQTKTTEDTIDALGRADVERSVEKTNLLITHPLLTNVERRYADMNEIEIDQSELRSDFVLLGHYHTFQQIAGRTNVWYAGSTDTFSFADDPQSHKGYVLLDTNLNTCSHIDLSQQRPVRVLGPISAWGLGPREVEQLVGSALQAAPAGGVVRIDLDGMDVEVFQLLDSGRISEAGAHLLFYKLNPVFRSRTDKVEDLPELSSVGQLWKTYLSEQHQLEQFDVERLREIGERYLERAIEATTESPS